jgi:hypothetical protein
MRLIESDDGRVVYRRGTRSAWWLAIAMPIGMLILYVLGGRKVMPYLFLAFGGIVMFVVAAFDEHVVIDIVRRAIVSSETFFGRPIRSESIPFSQVSRVAVAPNYTREPGKRRTRRDGFAVRIEWTTTSGEGGVQLDTFTEDAEVVAEAGKLARILGTDVQRIPV